jgi:hypothetical protein
MTDPTPHTPPRSKLDILCLLLGLIPAIISLYYLLLLFVLMNTNQAIITSPLLWDTLLALTSASMYALLDLFPICFLASLTVMAIGYFGPPLKNDEGNQKVTKKASAGVKLGYLNVFLSVIIFFTLYAPLAREVRHDQ